MSRDRDSDFDISAAFDDAQSNLPMAPASEDTDDGIFINWPGFDYDEDEARQPFDDDENEIEVFGKILIEVIIQVALATKEEGNGNP